MFHKNVFYKKWFVNGFLQLACTWMFEPQCSHALTQPTEVVKEEVFQNATPPPDSRDSNVVSFWFRDHHHLYKVRHLKRHISRFTFVAKDWHRFSWCISRSVIIHNVLGFFLFWSKIVKISLAFDFKQRGCFAWIRSLTFVEFCKCKFSEGYWYF